MSVDWWMYHVWQVWYMPNGHGFTYNHTPDRHAQLSPLSLVIASPPTTQQIGSVITLVFWSGFKTTAPQPGDEIVQTGVMQVWIWYQTTTRVLGDECTMSDMCVTCQRLWLYPQPHSRHTQISPWFSDQSPNLHINQVTKTSNEDHTGLNILPDHGRIFTRCM